MTHSLTIVLKVLTQHHEATGDPRVIPFLERYFAYQRAHLPERPLFKWGQARGAENVLALKARWLGSRPNKGQPLYHPVLKLL